MTGARPTGEASVHHPPESTELASVDPIYQYHPRPLYQDHGNQGLPYAAEDPFDPSFMLTATWPAVDETNLDQHINSWDALFGDDTFCTFFLTKPSPVLTFFLKKKKKKKKKNRPNSMDRPDAVI
jgi:hypothetical protein